jgi:hypothetical protein
MFKEGVTAWKLILGKRIPFEINAHPERRQDYFLGLLALICVFSPALIAVNEATYTSLIHALLMLTRLDPPVPNIMIREARNTTGTKSIIE